MSLTVTGGHKATRRLEKVFVDLQGPHAVEARGGYLYTMNMIDDCTNRVWGIPLKRKSDAFPEIRAWTLEQENLTHEKVGTFIMDNGELKTSEMDAWLAARGTRQVFTAPYTSAHNGRVERLHRTLLGKANAMRIYAKVPADLWMEFYLTAVHLHNKTAAISSVKSITPYEAWHRRARRLWVHA